MIDPDQAVESVTEDLIEDVLTDIETDIPHWSGAMPNNQIAREICYRVVRAIIPDLSKQTLGYCHCLNGLLAKDLEDGNCPVCGRYIALRIRRNP